MLISIFIKDRTVHSTNVSLLKYADDLGRTSQKTMQHMRKLTLAQSLYCRTGVRLLNWK